MGAGPSDCRAVWCADCCGGQVGFAVLCFVWGAGWVRWVGVVRGRVEGAGWGEVLGYLSLLISFLFCFVGLSCSLELVIFIG